MNLLDQLQTDYLRWCHVHHVDDPLSSFVRSRLPSATTTDRIMLRTLCSLHNRAEVFDGITKERNG